MDNIQIDERKRQIKRKRIRRVKTIQIGLICVLVCFVGIAIMQAVKMGKSRASAQSDRKAAAETDSEETEFQVLPDHTKGAVVLGKASIYDGMEEDSEELETLSFGDRVTLTEESDTWFHVKKNRVIGYMKKSDLVQFNDTKKQLALTFDDGPSSKTTPEILDALEEYNCRATFFVVGQNITFETGKFLQRAEKLECEIGNHTYSHANLEELKKKESIKKEIDKANEKIKEYVGKEASLVRTPYGAVNKTVLSMIGAPNIYWTIDTEDWKYRDTDRLIKVINSDAKDGCIILMHDIHSSTADAVATICKNLQEKDFEMVTVTELAAIKGTNLVNGKTYYSF